MMTDKDLVVVTLKTEIGSFSATALTLSIVSIVNRL